MEDDLPKVIIGDGGSSDDELDMSLEESYDPWKKKTRMIYITNDVTRF